MISPAIVSPEFKEVFPLMPEFIRNEDGAEKSVRQKRTTDCERNACKRWLKKHGKVYSWLHPVYLGDDLYSDYNTCMAVLDKGGHFIFTCKPDTHKWLFSAIDEDCLKEKNVRGFDGKKNHRIYRYRWYNGLEIREGKPTLEVNYLSLEIVTEETGKVTFKNTWVTDLPIDADNVVEMVKCARARWQIENGCYNVLKNRGYNLEHNFGHGKEYACEIYCLLNLLAYLMHNIMQFLDENYQKARKKITRRDEFFAGMRFCWDRFLFNDWEEFIAFIYDDPPPKHKK
jgi:hypothetical protein